MVMRFAKTLWPRSFRARLLLVYLAGLTVSAVLVGVGVIVLSERFNRYMLQYQVFDYGQGMAEKIQFGPDGIPSGIDKSSVELWPFRSLHQEVIVQVVDAQGRVVYSPVARVTALAPAHADFDPARQRFALDHEGVAMHAATVPRVHRGTTWYVQFALSDRMVLQLRKSIGIPAIHQGILVTCITFMGIFLVTVHLTLKQLLKPLHQASEEAQRITPQSLDARLEARNLPSELAPLVDAFNLALDRLQQGFRTQQEFLANAAHELKTPLALIRAQVELAPLDENRAYLLQDVDRMGRQVQQLLHLAEASEPGNYRIEYVDPTPTVLEACDYMERVAQRAGVELSVVFGDGVGCWDIDRGALFTLLKNLLENAIQHSPQGGVVHLAVGARGLVVTDQGGGVAEDQLGRLFERFWRGASRRDEGAGLGLSICQEIARAHRWRIEARPGSTGLEMHVLHL